MRSVVSLSVVALATALVACNRNEPSDVVRKDSVLGTPQVTKVDTVHPAYNETGLVVDSLHDTPKDLAPQLARFGPKEILSIYEAYRPLRKRTISQPELNAFLAKHKITEAELHAILAEGDRLGWQTAR